jgi:hypothetical protein
MANFSHRTVVRIPAFHTFIDFSALDYALRIGWYLKKTIRTVGTRTILCALYALIVHAGIGAFAIVIVNTIHTHIAFRIILSHKADAVSTVCINRTCRAVVGVGILIFIVDRYTHRFTGEFHCIRTITIVFTVIAFFSYGQTLVGTGITAESANTVSTYSRAIAEVSTVLRAVSSNHALGAALICVIALCFYIFSGTWVI